MRPVSASDIVISRDDRCVVASCDPDDEVKPRRRKGRRGAADMSEPEAVAAPAPARDRRRDFVAEPDGRSRVRAPRAKKSRMSLPHSNALGRFLPRPKMVVWSGLATAVVCVLVLWGWSLWRSPETTPPPKAVAQQVGDGALHSSAALGFRLQDVMITGRQVTPLGDIQNALGYAIGSPIMAMDLDAIRERLEALPAVRRAAVKRTLPSTLHLLVEERVAVAVWQHKGAYNLIDRDGRIIPGDASLLPQLFLVTGEGAPSQTGKLLEMLESEPSLAVRVKAAVRVGNRRWNLLLDQVDQGVEVRLPEVNAEQAWQRLARLEKDSSLSGQSVGMIDLRQPDRMVLNAMAVKPSTNNTAERD